MTTNPIKQVIEDQCRMLNLPVIGFASAAPFISVQQHYEEREGKGFQCEFERRDDLSKLSNPTLQLEGCKTIIVALLPYTPYKRENKIGYGLLSSGTADLDYHSVLKQKLDALGLFLKECYNISSKTIVDTSPLSDRAMAVRAGLGLIRRNGMFYHKTYGSYCYIGSLLMDQTIETNAVSVPKDPCASCRKCVEHCPGNAITGDYEINSNRCVSYLTQKKTLTVDEENKIGHYLYGCDVCQKICPANKGVKEEVVDTFVPYEVAIQELLSINNSVFNETYKKATCGWRGKKIMQRNGLVILGNQGHKENLSLIEACLSDSRPIIKETAIRALSKINQ